MKNITWLLLLYTLPTQRSSARVDLWRKLRRFGSVQLKNSAYVLPDEAAHYERFQWLSEEIRNVGGEASLLRVTEIEGMGEADIVRMFNEARDADYEELVRACRAIAKPSRKERGERELTSELEKLNRRFNEIREVDYFKASAADDAQMALERVAKLNAPRRRSASTQRLSSQRFVGRTWLTRPRPGIDRAGSAWLIRKFIDAKARFVFGAGPSAHPEAIPFDMANVEFSHHGDDCTFETLVKRFGIGDKAVHQIAEMVHDADLEDGKFQRDECIGVNAVLSGWEKTGLSDAELLAKGIECFEGLYRHFRK